MILKKMKEIKQKEKKKPVPTNIFQRGNNTLTRNNISVINNLYKNNFTEKPRVQNENLVNELEKTLGNLSNLFIT
jgi:hypothetical protein